MSESIKSASFESLWSAWPKNGTRDIARAAGAPDDSSSAGIADDSALRLSMAFNKTGHALPHVASVKPSEFTAPDGSVNYTDHQVMHRLLQSKFGKPRHISGQEHAMGRKGIMMFEGVPSIHDEYHMHFDLWDGKECATVADYWRDAKSVHFWELP